MKAPELQASEWFNTDKDLKISDFEGKVLVIEAFQMLCPGCVSHGVPLAQKIERTFPHDQVAVIGLHTVFEHHEAMTPVSLAAFLHEYRITFPVGVDMASDTAMPLTMQAYHMRGTPSLVLIDKEGQLRAQHLGDVSELQLGAEIANLVGERVAVRVDDDPTQVNLGQCNADGCTV
ncbi:redoxin domain-containing protein [Roseovarius sp. EL26]|uniref:redoxin domain-containing protein n=1 Tax=Roseovarius sp. EL26 TaxID=2126672 RepID=UPI000EA21BFB|nr:redoxin domain-containing protein [Roseovarius sp. EL26]